LQRAHTLTTHTDALITYAHINVDGRTAGVKYKIKNVAYIMS